MLVPLDIQRLRHVKIQVASVNPPEWEGFKNGVDRLGGVLVTSGLVHALLVGLKAKTESEGTSLKRAVEALASWLPDANSPVKQQVKDALQQSSEQDIGPDPVNKLALALIELDDVRDAIDIQAEAVRYLAQAKMLANAFKD